MAKKTGPKYEQAPLALRDMRAVYRRQKSKTPAQKVLLELLQKDPKKFMALMQQHEKDFHKMRVEVKKEKEGMDQGTKRCLALVEELLEEGKAKGEW